MKITNQLIADMRNDINEALKSVGEKYGLTFEAGSASYTDTCVDFKLKAVDPQENWNSCVAYTGLRSDDLGKFGLFGGSHKLKIIGFDRSARTNKVQLIDPDTGKRYHASVSDTISALKALDPARAGTSEATSAELEARAQRDFEIKAFICGLKDRVSYGQTFVWKGNIYKVIDLNTKAPKYPIVAENINTGVNYRFNTDVLPAKEGAV